VTEKREPRTKVEVQDVALFRAEGEAVERVRFWLACFSSFCFQLEVACTPLEETCSRVSSLASWARKTATAFVSPKSSPAAEASVLTVPDVPCGIGREFRVEDEEAKEERSAA